MKAKTQVYLSTTEAAELRKIARKRKRSVTDLMREAVRKTWLQKVPSGPVALWTKPSSKTSIEHDSIYDEE